MVSTRGRNRAQGGKPQSLHEGCPSGSLGNSWFVIFGAGAHQPPRASRLEGLLGPRTFPRRPPDGGTPGVRLVHATRSAYKGIANKTCQFIEKGPCGALCRLLVFRRAPIYCHRAGGRGRVRETPLGGRRVLGSRAWALVLLRGCALLRVVRPCGCCLVGRLGRVSCLSVVWLGCRLRRACGFLGFARCVSCWA